MIFRKVEGSEKPAEYLAQQIGRRLDQDKKVLWLVAGGSAIEVAIKASLMLKGRNLAKLTVSLTDERYGPVGHPDSNWRGLEDRGFSMPGASLLPVLKDGLNIEQAAAHYGKMLIKEIGDSDYSVALAGMGPDGHIFGIKPGSPSTNSSETVSGYIWDDYQRLTPTANTIKLIDEIVVYAMGPEKHQQLDNLEKDLAIDEQPVQLLKQLKNVILYNDYKGDAA